VATDASVPAAAGVVPWHRDPDGALLVGLGGPGGRAGPPWRRVADRHPLAAALAAVPGISAADPAPPGPHRELPGPAGPTWWWPVEVRRPDVDLTWRPAPQVADDHAPAAGLLADAAATTYRQVVVVRHARAGSRADWDGPDADRPLDPRGRAQAAALATLLAVYAVQRIHSSDARRCLETVGPLGAALGLPVLAEPLLSEDGSEHDPDAAGHLFDELVDRPGSGVVCTQRKTLGRVLPGLLRRLGLDADAAGSPRKGGLLVLHLPAGPGQAAVEELPPPPA
jgi:phosphohistidine phosphatase SixA